MWAFLWAEKWPEHFEIFAPFSALTRTDGRLVRLDRRFLLNSRWINRLPTAKPARKHLDQVARKHSFCPSRSRQTARLWHSPARTRIMFESRQGYHLFLQFVALTECLGGIRWGSGRFACFNAGEMNDTRGSAVYGRRDRQNRTRVQGVVPRVRSG